MLQWILNLVLAVCIVCLALQQHHQQQHQQHHQQHQLQLLSDDLEGFKRELKFTLSDLHDTAKSLQLHLFIIECVLGCYLLLGTYCFWTLRTIGERTSTLESQILAILRQQPETPTSSDDSRASAETVYRRPEREPSESTLPGYAPS